MRFNIKRIVPFLIGAILFSCSVETKVEQAVQAELSLHPKSQLLDLYKYFFQDVFGPGHLAPDSSAAARYLDYELDKSANFESYLIQNLEYRGEFARVNLSVVASGQISKEEFLSAFLKSAREFKLPDLADWMEEWSTIISTIETMNLNLPDFDNDRIYIDSILHSGDYVVHHSEVYSKEYDPHYRLFHKDELNCLNLSQ